jgi:hypothetical protein
MLQTVRDVTFGEFLWHLRTSRSIGAPAISLPLTIIFTLLTSSQHVRLLAHPSPCITAKSHRYCPSTVKL